MARKIIPPSTFNLAVTRERAHKTWAANYNRSVSVLARIDNSVPYWLFAIFFSVVALSGAHTTAAFELVVKTQILGVSIASVAMIMVEIGLLFASFKRLQVSLTPGVKLEPFIRLMEGLLFVSAIAVNLTGSLQAIALAGIDLTTTPGAIKFITGCIMVGVDALAVPICLVVVGSGIAKLIVERKDAPDPLIAAWLIEGPHVLQLAVYDELITGGMTPAQANNLAQRLSRDSFGKVAELPKSRGSSERNADKPKLERGAADKAVERLYANYPDFSRLPLTARAKLVRDECGASQTTAYGAIAKYESRMPTMGLGSHQGDQ